MIVNPVSGEGQATTEKIWQKIQRMFQVGQIVTDVISKSVHIDSTMNMYSPVYTYTVSTIAMLGI